MLKLDIVINDFTYLVHILKKSAQRKFKCMANIEVLDGNIHYLKDIYFIDYEIYNKYNNSDEIELYLNEAQKHIVFPSCEIKNHFGSSYTNFTQDTLDLDIDVVNFNKLEPIACDTIRVYHPFTLTRLPYILYVYTIINNINIHFICTRNDMMTIGGNTEFRVGNEIYSEYCECYIPNIEELITNENYDFPLIGAQTSINKLLRPFITYKKYVNDINGEYWHDVITDKYHLLSSRDDKYYYSSDGDMIMITDINKIIKYLLDAFIYYCGELKQVVWGNGHHEIYTEEYVKLYEDTNYYKLLMTTPINVMIYPYDTIENNIYTISETYNPNTELFLQRMNISLGIKVGFTYNNEDDYYEGIKIIGNFFYPILVDDIWETYKALNYIEYNEYESTSIKLRILLASDKFFQNIIFDSDNLEEYKELLYVDKISDFSIPLYYIMSTWELMPTMLIARVICYDEKVDSQIYSNLINITKEWYKYLVYEDADDKLNEKIIDMKQFEGKLVNNVSCYVKSLDKTTETSIAQYNKNVKVIYKPIFYRTSELLKINLKSSLTLNVGINLADYMSKVETFKLSINGKEIIEYARNDAYVIFAINTLNISATQGQYHILNQDDEYITSGTYTIS